MIIPVDRCDISNTVPKEVLMIELLRKRRSIRKYTSEPIDPAALDILLEALLRSPSSRTINPWEFVIVDDRELLARLSEAKEHGSSFVRYAPLAIVVCADGDKTDVWVEDCSIACILVQMVAESLGLGSCWIQIRNRMHGRALTSEKFVSDLLGLPDRFKVEAVIAVGHPDEKKRPVPAEALQYGKIRHNHYSRLFQRSSGQ
jgi:nitroreductase